MGNSKSFTSTHCPLSGRINKLARDVISIWCWVFLVISQKARLLYLLLTKANICCTSAFCWGRITKTYCLCGASVLTKPCCFRNGSFNYSILKSMCGLESCNSWCGESELKTSESSLFLSSCCSGSGFSFWSWCKAFVWKLSCWLYVHKWIRYK